MEKINCIICNSYNDHSIIEFNEVASQNRFNLTKCKKCNFVYLNPRIDEDNIRDYYKDSYYPFNNKNRSFYDHIYSFVQKFTFWWKRKIITYYNVNSRSLLDVGSGNNMFVKYMMKYKWKCRSYDKFINSSNINSLESIDDNSYSNVTLWHSLEHVHNVDYLIRNIIRIVKNDGYIYIACPNFSAIERTILKDRWIAYDIPRHLYHFSYTSMNNLLMKYNIQIIRSHRLLQDTFFNIILSKNMIFINKICLIIYSLLNIMLNKKKASSILYVCKVK